MTPDEVNALPERVRLYIHSIEANCDPAGTMQENGLLRDQTRQLDAMIARLKSELSCLTDSRDYWMGAESKIQRVAQALEAERDSCRKIGAENAIKLARSIEHVENLQERLQRIEQWCKAYPRDIFIEPMKKQWAAAAITLKNDPDCPSLDAISGSNMRHVVEGLMAQARDWEKNPVPKDQS